MKGQAFITIKDKNGNIKYNGKHNNQITDIFKKSMQQYLNDLPWLESNCTPPTREASDFQGITLHSEDLTDELNMKPILLTGGTSAKGSRDWHYAAAISAIVEESKISTSWSWAIEEPLSIKSLALCNESFVGDTDKIVQFAGFVSNKGFGWFLNDNSKGYAKKQVADLTKLRKSNKGGISRTGFSYGGVTYNEEYVLRGENTILTLSLEDYFKPTKSEEFEAKALRSFNISQFNGAYQPSSYFRILSTAAKDYIITFYNSSYDNIAIYEFPRSASSETFEPIKVFENIGTHSYSMYEGCQVSDSVILNKDADTQFIISIKSDGSVDGRLLPLRAIGTRMYDIRLMTTCPRTINQSYIVNYGAGNTTAQKPIFAHTTILNLETPITVEAGDILNITYEITATE